MPAGSLEPKSIGPRWLAVTAMVAAVSLAVGAGWLFRGTGSSTAFSNPLAGATYSPITDFDGDELDAAITPDGRFVAFMSDREGSFDVWVNQVGTGNFTNLTQGRAGDIRLTLQSIGMTGDGSEVWLSGGPGRRMRLVPILGGPMRNILQENTIMASWSPDGTRVAYFVNAPGDPFFVADSNGANDERILVHTPGRHQHFPTWSQDGEWIYLHRGFFNTREMDLWRVRPDGSELERLTELATNVAYSTPIDERTLLYVAPEADGAGPWLWALDLETKVSRRVSFGLERYISLSASAAGRRLVASVANPHSRLWRVPILDTPATEADAALVSRLASVRASGPRFGGEALFYLSSRGTGDGLWRYRDGESVELWNGGDGALSEPAAVSSDGSLVAVVLRQNESLSLQVMSAEGGQLRTLLDAVDVSGSASWSPDSEWIVTGGRDTAGEGLFRIPIDGGPPERLHTGEATSPVWSPDGSLIMFAGQFVGGFAPLLAVRPDGTPVELPDIELFTQGERLRFLPDGTGVVYMEGLGVPRTSGCLSLPRWRAGN